MGRGDPPRRARPVTGPAAAALLHRAGGAHPRCALRRGDRPGPRTARPGDSPSSTRSSTPVSSTATATRTCPRTPTPGGLWRGDWTRPRGRRSARWRPAVRREFVGRFAEGRLSGGVWDTLPCARAWKVLTRAILAAFYSHPWAWNEIGYGGPRYPRGYMRLGARAASASPTRRPRRSSSTPCPTRAGGHSADEAASAGQGRARTAGERFALPAAPPAARPAEPRPHVAL